MARKKNLGLVYLRRSTGKQEISLSKQLEWAKSAALAHAVELDASDADLTHMQNSHLHSHKSIRLDDGVTGLDLTRPGFLCLNQDAVSDRAVSHVFFYKRDRFARPEDAIDATQIEKKLLLAGITIVHSDGVSEPLRRGDQNITRILEPLLAYYQSGEEIRKHAERVLGAQQRLAAGGYRVGGNAPYGFVRVLVNAEGRVLEELSRGKVVRQPGCHVQIRPKDVEKIATWIQILQWRESNWGYKRIASTLNRLRVPSPDAGRTRRDGAVTHTVSGKWSQNTVAGLCRCQAILGIQEYGCRSEGRIYRLGPKGQRPLDEQIDLSPEGRPRTVENDASVRICRKVTEAQFDRDRWDAIQRKDADHGRTQRGIPRAKDPSRYPLAGRLIDLTNSCGSIFYGRTNQGRSVYTCGRYMRSGSEECASNNIDGEAILGLVLKTLRQYMVLDGRREKLRGKLNERARRDSETTIAVPHLDLWERLNKKHTALEQRFQVVERRLAQETDDDVYAGLTRQYKALKVEIDEAREEIGHQAVIRKKCQSLSPESRVDSAMALLDDICRITTDQNARAAINPLLVKLGLRVGLVFRPSIKGKKRIVQKLAIGQITLGNRPFQSTRPCVSNIESAEELDRMPPPTEVPVGDSIKNSAEPVNGRQPKGISTTKDNRGERI